MAYIENNLIRVDHKRTDTLKIEEVSVDLTGATVVLAAQTDLKDTTIPAVSITGKVESSKSATIQFTLEHTSITPGTYYCNIKAILNNGNIRNIFPESGYGYLEIVPTIG